MYCIVATMVFAGCGRASAEAQKIEKAQRDLQELAAGLERFKGAYGDYPQVPVDTLGSSEWLSSRRLWASLRGSRGSDMTDRRPESARQDFFAHGAAIEIRSAAGASGADAAYPVDPWGNGYRYRYIRDLDRGHYELYSMGPDGDAILGNPRDTNLRRDGAAINADNIFANQ